MSGMAVSFLTVTVKRQGEGGAALALRQRGQALHFGIEALEVAALALEQPLEVRHQFVVGREHAERRIVGRANQPSYPENPPQRSALSCS